jgi:hypothetical protein
MLPLLMLLMLVTMWLPPLIIARQPAGLLAIATAASRVAAAALAGDMPATLWEGVRAVQRWG